MATPRLFQDLRMALKCLYSLSSDERTSHLDSQKAHDFLLHIQARNVRRKLHSIQQSDRDQRNKNKNQSQEDVSKPSQLADEVEGSTWLACLAVLCCDYADSAERLFAAQTLMHRLRRAKLSEAIDLEMEDPNRYLSSDLNVNLHLLATDYLHWMNHFHPKLGMLVQQYLTEHVINVDTHEEQLKGELTILTLAAVTYLIASHATQDGHRVHPVVCTLGNSLATTALRLRYTPQSVSIQSINDNKATSFSVPIVTMILHSLMAAVNVLDPNKENASALFQWQCLCVGVIPEALLSSGGGAMGRISIDPRCIQAVHEELRQPSTGVYLWFEALRDCNLNDIVRRNLLDTCQSWAKSLPLPQDFIDHTVPLAGQLLVTPCTPQSKASALAYICAIFEVGAWTADFILTHSLGLSSEQLSPQPINKKKQSSRSKRRQKERIDSTATDDSRSQALAESRHRGDMACRTTHLIWDGLAANARHALTHSVDTGGGGPVGCLTACANACLPHWLRYSSSSSEEAALAVSIMELVQEVASHSDRNVRVLAYEPIFAANSTLLEVARARYSHVPPQQLTELESTVANHLFQCTMRLATSCEYPAAYFMKMNEDNDEEIEIERNDVRDLIRAICGCEGDVAKGKTSIPMDVSVGILKRVIQSCSEACNTGASLPPETAVHALSALAKPLNVFAEAYAESYRCEGISEILVIPIRTLERVHKSVIASFETLPIIEIFPVSRLSNLATSAFVPALSALCKLEASSNETDRALSEATCNAVGVSVHAAALSIVHIPELTAESTLEHSPFDIRGCFRSPGGEDHVGCLTLSRLAFESNELARIMVDLSPSLGLELCKLHKELKAIENERPLGVSHGKGVTAKSRRILVNTICRIVHMDSGPGQQEASEVLHDLFYSLIVSTAELSNPGDVERMYRITENVLDLSAFSPSLISEIFDDIGSEHRTARDQFLSGVVTMCRYGYSFAVHDDDVVIQWNRLRGAIVSLFRAAACWLPSKAFDAIMLLNRCECEAIVSQCELGALSTSPIFNESVISESSIPSGIFIHLLGEIIEKQQNKGIIALEAAKSVVLQTILHECPEPSFVDPRPTLCEAWFQSLVQVTSLIGSPANHIADNDSTRTLLADSCCVAVLLLLRVPLRRDRKPPNHLGMSLDGPQTRAMLSFLESYFCLGPHALRTAAVSLRYRLDLDIESLDSMTDDPASQGVGILGASLIRAASGGLPPWAIEVIPSLYSSLYVGCGNDTEVFCRMMQLSIKIRLSKSINAFGAILPGELLAGHYFESIREASMATFIEKTRDACRSNNAEGWRKFKVVLKQSCGGKKKSSLSLKPSFTTWDVDRI